MGSIRRTGRHKVREHSGHEGVLKPGKVLLFIVYLLEGNNTQLKIETFNKAVLKSFMNEVSIY